MKVDLFDFDLPEALIALRPAVPRSAAKLLEVDANGQFSDHHIADFPALLRPDDLLIFNDTKVVPAQLQAERRRGENTAAVGITLHRRIAAGVWRAFIKGIKKIRVGDQLEFSSDADNKFAANVVQIFDGGEAELDFELSEREFDAALAEVGQMPLPPYISTRRPFDQQDLDDYQTIYARHKGAVAAPTAGLHFDDRLFSALDRRGIDCRYVTLHVGAGTFLPVKADNTEDHVMHHEFGILTAELAAEINDAKQAGRRVIAVGTTSLRILESAAVVMGRLQPFEAATDIFITPGYQFKIVDGLLTNFHLPRSTLFMLVSALAGRETMQAAYHHAIASSYRFYSYGDASLLWKAKT
jgi:S-adenosylmethionine:tRNA ribosyltransferase-isomerase